MTSDFDLFLAGVLVGVLLGVAIMQMFSGHSESKEEQPESPHESGFVECFICTHRWVAVRPRGTQDLQCPSCGAKDSICG